MNKKILHIDMDGVIADFSKEIKKISPNTDTNSFSVEVDDICAKNPYIFHDLEPINDAIESVKELFNYFDIYFLSSPMWHVPESYIGKRIWLEKHFGQLAEKRLILTHRKDLVIGDYLVDDTIRHGVTEFKGEHIHFGNKKYPNWVNVMSYLRSL